MKTAIQQTIRPDWAIYNGDCCEIMPELPSDSMGFSIFSPPFSNLFVYSNSERDMGNCATDDEFMEHFSFMVRELFRITIPGRLAAAGLLRQLPDRERGCAGAGLRMRRRRRGPCAPARGVPGPGGRAGELLGPALRARRPALCDDAVPGRVAGMTMKRQ